MQWQGQKQGAVVGVIVADDVVVVVSHAPALALNLVLVRALAPCLCP